MPSPKVPCPECGQPKSARALLCGKCGKGKYERTPEIRRKMSESMTGLERPYARGVKRPDVAKKIAAAWTPAMREAARLRGLAFADDPEWRAKVGLPGEANPNYQGRDASEYGPGFSRGMKARLIAKRGGACEVCGATESLDVHHRDFAKTDHSEANLAVVCRACHKSLHLASSATT
jgi:hypothetical protein